MGFFADADANIAKANARWEGWFGNKTLGHQAGPFNSECLAKGYGPPVTRTCDLTPQKLHGIKTAQMLNNTCLDGMNSTCGALQGDDPVQNNACSSCLKKHSVDLISKWGCPGKAAGQIADLAYKIYCK